MAWHRQDVRELVWGKKLGALKGYLAIEGKKEDTAVAKPPPKEEPKMGEQTSNQKEEKCGLGPDCPFCKAQKKDVDSPHLQEQIEDQQQKPLLKLQAKRPKTLNITKTRQQREEEMERLNAKYNLDCFSDSNLILNQMKMNDINMNMVMKH